MMPTQAVIDKENVKILWDVNIQTDHIIEHRRPEIVVVHKENKMALLIDIAVAGDTRVDEKEQTKVDKYQDRQGKLKDSRMLKPH